MFIMGDVGSLVSLLDRINRIFRIYLLLSFIISCLRPVRAYAPVGRKDENQSAYRRKKLKDLTCGFKRHIIHLAVERNTILA